MPTYIPRQIKPVRERVETKLDRELILELERYCEYLDSDRDYVIAQALSVAFRKDKGFAAWREAHPMPQAKSEETDGTRGPSAGSPQ
jgi:hypothetical protein